MEKAAGVGMPGGAGDSEGAATIVAGGGVVPLDCRRRGEGNRSQSRVFAVIITIPSSVPPPPTNDQRSRTSSYFKTASSRARAARAASASELATYLGDSFGEVYGLLLHVAVPGSVTGGAVAMCFLLTGAEHGWRSDVAILDHCRGKSPSAPPRSLP